MVNWIDCVCLMFMLEIIIEEHGEWKELAKMMPDVMAPPEALFHTANARDQVMFILI